MGFAEGFNTTYGLVDRHFARQNENEQNALNRQQRQAEFDQNLQLNRDQLKQTADYQGGVLKNQEAEIANRKATEEARTKVMQDEVRQRNAAISEARKVREQAERRTVLFGGWEAARQTGDEARKAQLLPFVIREFPSMKDLLDPRVAEAQARFIQSGKSGQLPAQQDLRLLGDSLFAPQMVGKVDDNGKKIVGINTVSVSPVSARAPYKTEPDPPAAAGGNAPLFGLPSKNPVTGAQPAVVPGAAASKPPAGAPAVTATLKVRYEDGTSEDRSITRPVAYWMDSVAAQGVLYHAFANDPTVAAAVQGLYSNGGMKPLSMQEINDGYQAAYDSAGKYYDELVADVRDPNKDQTAAMKNFIIAATGEEPKGDNIDEEYLQALKMVPRKVFQDNTVRWDEWVNKYSGKQQQRPEPAQLGDVSTKDTSSADAAAERAMLQFQRINGGPDGAGEFAQFVMRNKLNVASEEAMQAAYNQWQLNKKQPNSSRTAEEVRAAR